MFPKRGMLFFRRLSQLVKMSTVSTVIIQKSASPRKEPKPEGRPPHHCNDTQTLFKNPWESFGGKSRLAMQEPCWKLTIFQNPGWVLSEGFGKWIKSGIANREPMQLRQDTLLRRACVQSSSQRGLRQSCQTGLGCYHKPWYVGPRNQSNMVGPRLLSRRVTRPTG